MKIKPTLLFIALPVIFEGILCSSSALAEAFPVTGGLKAGVTDIKYQGESATGYHWELTLGYEINSYTTITSGFGQTKADIQNAQGIDGRLTSNSVPLTLQFTLPTSFGNIYARGGANYYQNVYGDHDDSGFGALGAIGVNFSSLFNPGGTVEITYRNSGDASSSAILLGADIGF